MYYKIDTEDSELLGLAGADLMVYSALKTRCKLGVCKDGVRKIAKFSCCGGKDTASRSLKSLVVSGLVVKTEDGYMVSNMETKVSQTETEMSQIETPVSQVETDLKESSKENINKIKIKTNQSNKEEDGIDGVFDYSKDFLIWWGRYNPLPEYNNRMAACYKNCWLKMDTLWRQLAIDRARHHLPNDNPYYYLKHEMFLDNRIPELIETNSEGEDGKASNITGEPTWLSGDEQHYRMKNGETLAFCKKPGEKAFGTVSTEDAAKYGLEVVRYMKPESVF